MGHYRLVEHTADMGIEATGDTLAELFEQAGCGLRQIITAAPVGTVAETVTIEVEAADAAELLVGWLGELLYLFDGSQLLPVGFTTEAATATRYRVRVSAERFDPQRDRFDREVKAVTYHQVRVERRGKGWRARVYVDL